MNRAVLLSIQPWFCSSIFSGEKTLEIRKTKPQIQAPFKCYIYCTQCSQYNPILPYNYRNKKGGYSKFLTSHVIGEFICDQIDYLDMDSNGMGFYEGEKFVYLTDKRWNTGLTRREFLDYSEGKRVYGWHISNLIIYDTPKLLSDFKKACRNDLYCESCAMYSEYTELCGNSALTLRRPPQSWCYVQEDNR